MSVVNDAMPTTRWARVGGSTLPNPEAAGTEAARQAAGADASLLMITATDVQDPWAIIRGVRAVAPDVPMIGASSAGDIGPSGLIDGVSVVALGGKGLSVSTRSAVVRDGDLRRAGYEAAGSIEDVPTDANRALVMLVDGLPAEQKDFVRGAYARAGATVPLVGGSAARGGDRPTWQIHNETVMTTGVATAAIASEGPIGVGLCHNWRKLGQPMLVTRAEGNVVHTLDGEPAIDAYLRAFDAPSEIRHDPVAFEEFGASRPFGIDRRDRTEAKSVAAVHTDSGALRCLGNVPEGSMVWLMQGDRASILDAADRACADARDAIGGVDPVAMLAFDCISRRQALGDDGARTEIEHIISAGNGAAVGGFYTFGEIARTSGIHGFHNNTLVILALG